MSSIMFLLISLMTILSFFTPLTAASRPLDSQETAPMNPVIFLNGTRIKPEVISLRGRPEQIQTDDLMRIGHQWWIPYRGERRLELEFNECCVQKVLSPIPS